MYIVLSNFHCVFTYSFNLPCDTEEDTINRSHFSKKKTQHLEELNGLLKTLKQTYIYPFTPSIPLSNHLNSYEVSSTRSTAVNKTKALSLWSLPSIIYRMNLGWAGSRDKEALGKENIKQAMNQESTMYLRQQSAWQFCSCWGLRRLSLQKIIWRHCEVSA